MINVPDGVIHGELGKVEQVIGGVRQSMGRTSVTQMAVR